MGFYAQDLCDEDYQERVRIQGVLKRYREDMGISQEQLSVRNGLHRATTSSIERRPNWRLATLQRHARTLGLKFVVTPVGFPPDIPLDDEAVILGGMSARTPQREDALAFTKLKNYLIRARVHAGVSRTQIATAWGRSVDSIALWEVNATEETMIYSIQRYARAIPGGSVVFDVKGLNDDQV